jgi:DNA invertase Pin-like site-specific DNA recombinase
VEGPAEGEADMSGTVAAYIRVSSRGQNHATQRSAIEKVLRAGQGDVTWYAEKRSAKTMDRPELQRLLADIRAGHVRTLYLFKLDRLTRSGVRDTVNTVNDILSAGCTLITATDGLPPLEPGKELPLTARIVLTVLALAAEMELSIKNDRIAAARDRHEEEGLPWGRPRKWDDAKAAQVRKLKAEGRSVRDIAVAVKLPRATVGRILKPSQKGEAREASPGLS